MKLETRPPSHGLIGGNARAALAALISATGPSLAGQRLCATLLDSAVDSLMTAPAAVLTASGGSADQVDRLAGVALLTELCSSCGFCPRGQSLADTQDSPVGVGPIGRHRRRGL